MVDIDSTHVSNEQYKNSWQNVKSVVLTMNIEIYNNGIS